MTPAVRRITALDMVRDQGRVPSLTVTGRGRDVLLGPGRMETVLSEASIEVVVEDKARVRSIHSDAPGVDLSQLAGRKATAGFRCTLKETLPDLPDRQPLVYRMLYDIPMAVIVPGYALEFAAGDRPARSRPLDVCAGWQREGMWAQTIALGRPISVVPGPTVSPNETSEWGWSKVPPLARGGFRRFRCLTIRCQRVLLAEAKFRDVFLDHTGLLRVVHEYTVSAELEPDRFLVVDLDVEPGSLPSSDCLRATASAAAVQGNDVTNIPRVVRQVLKGPTSCSHLTDVLSTLTDVPGLVRHLKI